MTNAVRSNASGMESHISVIPPYDPFQELFDDSSIPEFWDASNLNFDSL